MHCHASLFSFLSLLNSNEAVRAGGAAVVDPVGISVGDSVGISVGNDYYFVADFT